MNDTLRPLGIAALQAASRFDACEREIDVVLAAPADVPPPMLAGVADRALALHRALSRDPQWRSAPAALRERLHRKLVRALGRGAECLRACGRHEHAIEYLEMALQLDPSADQCRQALAQMNRALERNARILRDFGRVRRQLGLSIGA